MSLSIRAQNSKLVPKNRHVVKNYTEGEEDMVVWGV